MHPTKLLHLLISVDIVTSYNCSFCIFVVLFIKKHFVLLIVKHFTKKKFKYKQTFTAIRTAVLEDVIKILDWKEYRVNVNNVYLYHLKFHIHFAEFDFE